MPNPVVALLMGMVLSRVVCPGNACTDFVGLVRSQRSPVHAACPPGMKSNFRLERKAVTALASQRPQQQKRWYCSSAVRVCAFMEAPAPPAPTKPGIRMHYASANALAARIPNSPAPGCC